MHKHAHAGLFSLPFLFCLVVTSAVAQTKPAKLITPEAVGGVVSVLASDDMQGRRTFSTGIEKAAAYIADEFEKAGLMPLPDQTGFLQTFSMVRPSFVSAEGTLNGRSLNQDQIIVLTTQEELRLDEKSGYEVVRFGANDTVTSAQLLPIINGNRNTLVFMDSAHLRMFNNLKRFKREQFSKPTSSVFILSSQAPVRYSVLARHNIREQKLSNVVGIIPGKNRPNEYVIFSAHYDHLGIGKPNAEGDSIFNGANDDASGTTAVILLARYYAQQPQPERTLVFVAFTAEEVGGFGSQYFSRQMNPDEVTAMFNIEMIGSESKWGKNNAFITGFERSDFGTILQKNLKGSSFRFHPDPYPAQNLFYRSDNATLARLGVPAHTISTTQIDKDAYYHKQDDELNTLDLQNMADIIEAIALSARGIINGTDTPSRVDKSKVR